MTDSEELDSTLERASGEWREGQVHTALALAHTVCRQADSLLHQARALRLIGALEEHRGKTGSALRALRAALTAATQAASQHELAPTLAALGDLLASVDQRADAQQMWAQAERSYLAGRQPAMAARVALDHGKHLGHWQGAQDALGLFRRAAKHSRLAQDAPLRARAADRSAAALTELGRFDEALDELRTARHLQETIGDRNEVAHATYRLGWTLKTAGNCEVALGYLNDAWGLYSDVGDYRNCARCDAHAAECLEALGSSDQAIGRYRRACAVLDGVGDDDELAVARLTLATALDVVGAIDEATELRIRALEVTSNSDLRSGIRVRQARALLRAGHADEAIRVLDAESGCSAPGDDLLEASLALIVRAEALLQVNLIASARELAEQAARGLDGESLPDIHADAMVVLAECARIAQDQAAEHQFLTWAVTLRLLGGDPDAALTLAHRAASLRQEGHTTSAAPPTTLLCTGMYL